MSPQGISYNAVSTRGQGKNYARLYDRMAPFYGILWAHVPFWREYSMAVLPWLPATGDVLEIGPGPGLLLAELSQRDSLVVGLDLSTGMLRQTQRRLQAGGMSAYLVRGDAVALPFLPASFDAIVMTFVFSAIPDGQKAMDECARVLRPGGILAMVDACIPEDKNLPARLLAGLWSLFGDFMRNEATLMRTSGLKVLQKQEFGVFHSIRLTVGQKATTEECCPPNSNIGARR